MPGVIDQPLGDVVAGIRDEVVRRLQQAGPPLDTVVQVHYGHQQRIGRMETPALWVVPEPWQPEVIGGHRTGHDVAYNIVSLLKDMYPSEGLREAERLAYGAYDVLMADRTLGGLVSDVRPGQIDPAHEATSNPRLCFAAVQLKFRLQRRE